MFFLARLTLFVFGRRLMGGRGEASIAAAPAPSARDHEPLTLFGEIEKPLAGIFIPHDSSHRNFALDRRAFVPLAVAALAMPAALRGVLGIESKLEKRVAMAAGNQRNVAAPAAIAAAGTASRDELLAPEGETSVAAIPGLYFDSNFIDEHKRPIEKPLNCIADQRPNCL